MPHSCCAVGCTNRKVGKNSKLPFYGMPKRKTPIEKRRREAWIQAIPREDWKTWSYDRISKAKICGEHFISGKRSDDPEAPNWVPTIFDHSNPSDVARIKYQSKTRARYERHTIMMSLDNAVVTDGDNSAGWKLFGTPVKEEKLDSYGITEEMQKQTLECDVYVKEEELDSDVYVKEGLTDSIMDEKEDEIGNSRTLNTCATTKIDGHNPSSVFVADGLM